MRILDDQRDDIKDTVFVGLFGVLGILCIQCAGKYTLDIPLTKGEVECLQLK